MTTSASLATALRLGRIARLCTVRATYYFGEDRQEVQCSNTKVLIDVTDSMEGVPRIEDRWRCLEVID